MTPDVREALEKSILHWEENLEIARDDRPLDMCIYDDSCALCQLFKYEINKARSDCSGCPVQKHSGDPHCGCLGTSWETVHDIVNSIEDGRDASNEELIFAVEGQVEFLKSLRED